MFWLHHRRRSITVVILPFNHHQTTVSSIADQLQNYFQSRLPIKGVLRSVDISSHFSKFQLKFFIPIPMATNANIGDFCEELLREILLNLPVKSLLRFKCMCKNWGSLINSPSFTVEHLNFSKKKPLQHLIYDYGAPEDAPSFTLVSDNGIDEQNFQRFGDNSENTNLLGSIDGLFFVETQIDDRGILCALWNPANREVRYLPAVEIGFEPFELCDRHFGFGLDPMTKDYKVVHYNHQEEYAALYSYCRDSWKIFKHDVDQNKNSDCQESIFDTTTYVNGSYYWLLMEDPKCRLLSFDFVNEVFVEMEGPSDVYSWGANLISLVDSIAILNAVDSIVFDVWVMIQSGVWNKFATFNWIMPVKSCYDSFLILESENSQLVTYNVRTNKMRLFEFHHPRLRALSRGGGCGVYYYKESLVTIKRQGPNGELDLRRCLTKLVDKY